jgi:hypothetical protein
MVSVRLNLKSTISSCIEATQLFSKKSSLRRDSSIYNLEDKLGGALTAANAPTINFMQVTPPGKLQDYTGTTLYESPVTPRPDSGVAFGLHHSQGAVMSTRTPAKNLPADPNNFGSVFGWAVVEKSPWRFIDIYASQDIAEAEAKARGPRFSIEYGSHRLGTSYFIGALTPPPASAKK